MRTTRLQVQPRDVDPPVRRTLDVPAASTLDEVHHLLQAAMGWTESHLHCFETGAARYAPPGPDSAELEETDEAGVGLSALPTAFTYVYDFGDFWEHDVQVLGAGGDRAGCVDAEGACPPEDCGGAPGYEQLCAVLADGGDPEHDEMRAWTTRGPVPSHPARVDLTALDRRVHETAGAVPATVRLLLQLADGVKLTPAGRLPRSVVRAVHEVHPSWYDLGRPASIEDDLPPLVALHTLLREVGLLRLRHGVLRATKAADDDLATIRRLRTALPVDTFGWVLATTATALLTTGPLGPTALARQVLPEVGPGWSRDGRDLTVQDVTDELRWVRRDLQALDQVVVDRHTWSAGPSARTLFPRTVLLAALLE